MDDVGLDAATNDRAGEVECFRRGVHRGWIRRSAGDFGVSERIDRLTPRGVALESGRELEADIVVTATGLNMLPFGRMELVVDGEPVRINETVAYKSMMLSGVPNFAFVLGYINISWTLKVDLMAEHLCRLLAHMDRCGYAQVVPEHADPGVEREPFFDFDAGYMKRGLDAFPRRGSDGPWTARQDYAVDRARLRDGAVQDPALRFTAAPDRQPAPTA